MSLLAGDERRRPRKIACKQAPAFEVSPNFRTAEHPGGCSVSRQRTHNDSTTLNPNHMKVSTRNKAAGNTNIVKGDTKTAVGKVTGSRTLQAKGRVQKAVGRIQKKVGARQKADGY